MKSNLDEFSAILVIICSHDGRGELIRLNWSHFARDSHLDASIDQVTKVHAAPLPGPRCSLAVLRWRSSTER